MKIGVYPGSFDPFTIGHLDVLKNAAGLFDVVYVAVLNNSAKSPVFSVEERVEMIDRVIESEGLKNVRSGSFSGLLVDYTKQIGAQYIIRGLRAITDFEYEFQINAVNRHLNPDIRTVYFMANPEHSFLSSSSVREIGEMGGSIEGLVPLCNYHYLRERLARQK
ncbi:MAG: pantetheine-phosphate adenylyltransferase [Clostridia bacterium]|jgi:pantetheine-phosphate adenylyltransferase|nr:pantetheine-phosphate adenylyltransferase [Clostridia bacterium]